MQGIKKCRFSDGIFNVLPLFWCDGWMGCRTFVWHQNPKHIPKYPKATWERKNNVSISVGYGSDCCYLCLETLFYSNFTTLGRGCMLEKAAMRPTMLHPMQTHSLQTSCFHLKRQVGKFWTVKKNIVFNGPFWSWNNRGFFPTVSVHDRITMMSGTSNEASTHLNEEKDTNHRHRILKATQSIARVSQLKAWPPLLPHKILVKNQALKQEDIQ